VRISRDLVAHHSCLRTNPPRGITIFPLHSFDCLIVVTDVAHELLREVLDGGDEVSRDHKDLSPTRLADNEARRKRDELAKHRHMLWRVQTQQRIRIPHGHGYRLSMGDAVR